jgi:molecular chaperone Hsp33
MSESAVDESVVRVVCRFVRGRNALLCAGDFGAMFMDLYLHLGQTGVVLGAGADEKLKLLLAALTLHAASRPHAETCAWTMHLEEERMNLFAVAENPSGHVTGQVFTENVRSTGGNVLHAEVAQAGGARRRSSVDFAGADILRAAAEYYERSEQRPARYFELGGDRFALLAAQPDCDTDWLAGVGREEVMSLADDESRPPLETRTYLFFCGCSPVRVAGALAPALQRDLDGVFGGDTHITVTCPRCGLRHELARELFGGEGN